MAGGMLAIGDTTTIRYRVQVNAGVADSTQVTNQATANFTGGTAGFNLTDSSNPTTVIVSNRADLAVTKVISNPNPNLGDTITYTVTLTNNGPQDATGVQVTDQLPASLTLVSATPSQGSYNAATGVWTVGNVANAASAALTIQAVVVTPGVKTNTATVRTLDQFDLVPGNNSDDALVTPQQADLALTKTVDNSTPNVGDTITYTVTLTNNGPDAATNVTVLDLLPTGVIFLFSAPSQGSFDSTTRTWTVGTVASGAAPTLQITVQVNAAGSLVNTALITGSDQFDPDQGNNTTSTTLTVPPQPADLAIAKSVSNPTPNVGDTITYTVTLTNNGPGTATSLLILDILPAGLTFISAAPSQGEYDPTTNIWQAGTVPAGGTLTLLLTV